MSTTITPAAASYTKRGKVSNATTVACIDQLEADLIAKRNAGNSNRIESALYHLQLLADLLAEVHQ